MTKKEKAIIRAKELIKDMGDAVHKESHMEQVLVYANEIYAAYPEADKGVLDIAVWWHDLGRSKKSDNHAEVGGEIAKEELKKIGFDQDFINEVAKAIISHSNSSAKMPETIEAKILKDADKLDFLTVGRWQSTIDFGEWWAIEAAIRKIPLIRNQILSLKESKKIFDRLFTDLVLFARNCTSSGFEKYRSQVLGLKVKDNG